MPKNNITIDIQILDDRWKKCIDGVAIENTISKISDVEKCDNFELSVCLTNDEEIQKLNHDYRGKEKPTNVLSFPNEALSLEMKDRQVLLGDIVLSYDTIKSEALKQDKTFANHTIHLIVHGFLHLMGYDHMEKTEAEVMEAQEIKILSLLKIDNPYTEKE